jgi:DNA-binding FadR family transcriptional regulator
MNIGIVPRAATLSDQVIARLRAEIVSGQWPVGSRIPTEPELVERLGVARNTVREAVRALAHNGLLAIRQGSGTYVVATSELAGLMGRRFAGADPLHVAELRGALEETAAGLAAGRRDEADLGRLDALLAEHERTRESGVADALAAADAALHLAVVAASHNEVLVALHADLGQVLRDLRGAGPRSATGTAGAAATGPRPASRLDHAPLIAAIRASDPGRAAAEARGHAVRCGVSDA